LSKVNVNVLPVREFERKTFEFPIDGDSIKITVRRLGEMDTLSLQGHADEISAEFNGIIVDGEPVPVKGDTGYALAVVMPAQKGGPEERYTVDEFLTIMARVPGFIAHLLTIVQWCIDEVSQGPPE